MKARSKNKNGYNLTKNELLIFDKSNRLSEIDVDKDSKNIIVNPQVFFSEYLKDVDETFLPLIKLQIFSLMKSSDRCKERGKEDASCLVERYGVSGYLDILLNFYTYAMEMVNDIIKNSANSILDFYNDKRMSKKSMEESMASITKSLPSLMDDKKMLEAAIKQTQDEIDNVNKMLNREGPELFS